jgi:hypothetical protein
MLTYSLTLYYKKLDSGRQAKNERKLQKWLDCHFYWLWDADTVLCFTSSPPPPLPLPSPSSIPPPGFLHHILCLRHLSTTGLSFTEQNCRWHTVPVSRFQRDQRGVALLTVEPEVNGNSLSTYERGSFLIAGPRDFFPALAALISPVQNIFFHTADYFSSFVPISKPAGQVVVPGRLSLNMCLW